MVLKRIFIISILIISVVGCSSNSNEKKIRDLRIENDSLKKIINDLNQKYIFDSITIRAIPSYKNTYKKNTTVQGEIVVVGFNTDESTNIILADSISYNSKIEFYNPDTLKLVDGGFRYNKILGDSLKLQGIIQLKSEYGKTRKIMYNSLIRAKEN